MISKNSPICRQWEPFYSTSTPLGVFSRDVCRIIYGHGLFSGRMGRGGFEGLGDPSFSWYWTTNPCSYCIYKWPSAGLPNQITFPGKKAPTDCKFTSKSGWRYPVRHFWLSTTLTTRVRWMYYIIYGYVLLYYCVILAKYSPLYDCEYSNSYQHFTAGIAGNLFTCFISREEFLIFAFLYFSSVYGGKMNSLYRKSSNWAHQWFLFG